MDTVKAWLLNAAKSVKTNFLGVVVGYPYTAGIIALGAFVAGAWVF